MKQSGVLLVCLLMAKLGMTPSTPRRQLSRSARVDAVVAFTLIINSAADRTFVSVSQLTTTTQPVHSVYKNSY